MLLPYAALAETGPEDAPQFATFLDAAGSLNVVNSKLPMVGGAPAATVKEYAEKYVWEVVRRAKQRRLGLEQEWLEIQRMAVMQHDSNQAYKGRSNAYMPVYVQNRRTLVRNLSKGMFPSDDYMDVTDMEQGDTEGAKAAKLVVEYEFDHSGLRQTIKNFLGQYVDFGIGVLKCWYRKEPKMKPRPGDVGAMAGMAMDMDEGVTIASRSIFNVVVYPEWAESKRELMLEAERLEVPIAYVNYMAQTGRWENVKDALTASGGFNDEWDWVNMTTLNDVAGIPNTFELRSRAGSPVESVIAIEAWTKMPLPANQYGPGEMVGAPLPVRVVFINGVCVCVRRNPFYHQESPFEYARDNLIEGSFYGDGAGRKTRPLQYLINDFTNQTNDGGIYTLNPMAAVNTNYFSGNVGSYRPGHVFKTRDIDKAIKFFMPTADVIRYGGEMTDRMTKQAQDAAATPAILQASKAADTATSSQILQHNAATPLSDQVEDIETDCMIPLMEMAFNLSQQYRDQAFVRTLADGALVQFLPSQIRGRMAFKFLSSSQAVNRQQRQQGLMMFADLAGKLGQALAMQGQMLNPIPILQRVWSDGLGFRGFDRLVVPMPMMPQAPGMPPPGPGVPPPPGAGGPPGAQRPPSAVSQSNVPGAAQNEPAIGEGEHMANVRDAVEATTGPQGAMNMPGGLGSVH